MNTKLAEMMNQYIADTSVEYVKLHNLHWNVTGGQFKAVHEYIETLYDALADVVDATAEVLKMNDQMPLGSMKDYLAITKIEELDNVEKSVKSVLEIALRDMKLLKEEAESIRKEAQEDDSFEVSNKMESDIENYAKTIWFVSSMLK
ncbi:Dps family protein [Hespellia stercorisuis]|uniref:Starvation-inducible DNA-binding protein n=1 Tax=Hespellia stercorisuis DSM 15480 TaxID=1121950 RepID=A0A1M6I3A3_9FIRM|nr:DNA starvation/stationary phase protection protein [Hespellia stercorisuis]SHJ28890.1 starvation-inducible DNA-binding protein [Hespellia stercorisuis DSM 15480]